MAFSLLAHVLRKAVTKGLHSSMNIQHAFPTHCHGARPPSSRGGGVDTGLRKGLSAQCGRVSARGVDALWKTCFGKRGAGLSDEMQVSMQASMQACMQVSMRVSMQASSDEMQVTKGKVREGSPCAATQCYKDKRGAEGTHKERGQPLEKLFSVRVGQGLCSLQPLLAAHLGLAAQLTRG